MNENTNIVVGAFLGILFLYYQESHLFYKTQKHFCDKYYGHCEKCECWSCDRKKYIDEYKNYKSEEYIKQKPKKNIFDKIKQMLEK